MSRQVWLSGAGGFVGRHLARRLLDEGCRVVCLIRSPGSVAIELQQLGAEIVYGDLLSPESYRDSLAGCDWVFHLAAAYRDGGTDRESFWRVNVQGTGSLLQAAVQAGVKRFVYCSTVGVHGDCAAGPLNEASACAPHEEYGHSKLQAEGLVGKTGAESALETVIIRPVGIYGPGDWRLGKMFTAIARRRFAIIGSGRNRYHMTYIDDLVQAFWLAAKTPAAAGQTYIIGGDEVPTIDELSRLIAGQLGVTLPKFHVPFWPVYALAVLCEGICRPLRVSPPLFRRRLDFFSVSRWFDTGKARRELGYRPLVDLQQGLARTIEWYRQQGFLAKSE